MIKAVGRKKGDYVLYVHGINTSWCCIIALCNYLYIIRRVFYGRFHITPRSRAVRVE